MLTIKLNSADDVHDYFFGYDTDKGLIYENIVKSINEGIKSNVDFVTVFEIIINDGEDIIMDSYREEWPQSLSEAMSWYEQQEEYDICAKIRDLLQKLN